MHAVASSPTPRTAVGRPGSADSRSRHGTTAFCCAGDIALAGLTAVVGLAADSLPPNGSLVSANPAGDAPSGTQYRPPTRAVAGRFTAHKMRSRRSARVRGN